MPSETRKAAAVSNPQDDCEICYVNGANTDITNILQQAQSLADALGRKIHIIENKSQMPLVDYAHALAGVCSSRLGSSAEPEACQHLRAAIESAMHAGKRMQIHAFSQGGIITQNVIRELVKEHGPQALCGVAVVTYGSLYLGWPDGIRVRQFAYGTDVPAQIIAGITREAGSVKAAALPKDVGEDRGDVCRLPGLEHNLAMYLQDLPLFAATQSGNAQAMAAYVCRSIKNGCYSDAVHYAMIDAGVRHFGAAFLGALNEHSDATVNGQKAIGGFVLPLPKEISYRAPAEENRARTLREMVVEQLVVPFGAAAERIISKATHAWTSLKNRLRGFF